MQTLFPTYRCDGPPHLLSRHRASETSVEFVAFRSVRRSGLLRLLLHPCMVVTVRLLHALRAARVSANAGRPSFTVPIIFASTTVNLRRRCYRSGAHSVAPPTVIRTGQPPRAATTVGRRKGSAAARRRMPRRSS